MKTLVITLFICSILFSYKASAQQLLRSSVSPEFINGLHAKYLKYLAENSGLTLDINPMPFARRIQAMRKGELDVMVGLQRRWSSTDEIHYLLPSYEKLSHTFFVRKGNEAVLQKFEDLRDLSIGVTRYATYFDRFEQEDDLIMVSVGSLRQKIKLLRNGRIDTFIHYKQSTLPTLEKMGLSGEVVEAPYQSADLEDYYFTVSSASPLISRKAEFEKVIAEGVKAGDFARIRREHYDRKK